MLWSLVNLNFSWNTRGSGLMAFDQFDMYNILCDIMCITRVHIIITSVCTFYGKSDVGCDMAWCGVCVCVDASRYQLFISRLILHSFLSMNAIPLFTVSLYLSLYYSFRLFFCLHPYLFLPFSLAHTYYHRLFFVCVASKLNVCTMRSRTAKRPCQRI